MSLTVTFGSGIVNGEPGWQGTLAQVSQRIMHRLCKIHYMTWDNDKTCKSIKPVTVSDILTK